MDAHELFRQRSREAAIEILSLFDRISRLTARARRAAARDEPRALARVLDRRQVLYAEAAERVHRLGVLCRDCPGRAADLLSPVLARVRRAAAQVQAENEDLASLLAGRREQVTEAILRADAASRAATAYRPASRFARLDLTH